MVSISEENYLKSIYHDCIANGGNRVSTSVLAEMLLTKPASVTEMVKRLAEKGYLDYKKYQGVELTPKGRQLALQTIRKHRLWEVFLVEKLGFPWDEIHEIAEQLEHIQSVSLTERLADFLGHPDFDPHGDPIPNAAGDMPALQAVPLTVIELNQLVELVGVTDDSSIFLQHLSKNKLAIGAKLTKKHVSDYDYSVEVEVNNSMVQLSEQAAANLLVVPTLS